MFGAFERKVAGRYLRARKGERFVSIIAVFSLTGIALGVATLIIVMSVMNGFRQELLGKILGVNGDIAIHREGGPMPQFESVLANIRAMKGVSGAVPLIDRTVGLKPAKGNYSGGLVRGIRPDDLRAMKLVSGNIRVGSLADFEGDDAIVIGSGLAASTGSGVGSRIDIYSSEVQNTPFGSIPRGRPYTVVAIFKVGFTEVDSGLIFMPMDAAQILFRVPGAVDRIDVTTADPNIAAETAAAIAAGPSGAGLLVSNWTQDNNAFFSAMAVERNVMFLILTLIIVVAAFNVISSLIMLVRDKTGDIAVMRTVGAESGAILRIFLMCGAFVGVAGTVTGTLIGIVFCLNIDTIKGWVEHLSGTNLFNPEVYFLSHLPAVVDWREVCQVVGMAVGLSLMATVYPSWRAARTDPVEALRNE